MSLPWFLAQEQEIGTTGKMILGAICALAGVWFSIAVRNQRIREMFHWGEGSKGHPMSSLGAAATALVAYLFSIMFFASAFGWTGISPSIFYVTLGAVFLAVFVSLRDYSRNRKR
ncbi:MAG: hypothetical protein ABJB69_04705 [Spartobacteria bacterium]